MRIIASLIVAFFSALSFSYNASAQQPPLRVRVFQSAGDPVTNTISAFKREVESKTNGAITIDIVQSEAAVASLGLETLRAGINDMAVLPITQYATIVPIAGVFVQPFLLNTSAIVRAAVNPNSEMRTVVEAEILKRAGTRVLWWKPNGPNVVFSKGLASNPQAMKGRQVGVSDAIAADFITHCGGVAHMIPDAKFNDAMEKGVIDSVLMSLFDIKSQELWRKTDTISKVHSSENLLLVVMNEKTWQRLNQGQQRVVLDAAKSAETAIWAALPKDEAQAEALAVEKGMKIVELVSSDVVNWRVCSSSMIETFMSNTGALGAKMFAVYGKLRASQ